MHPTDRSASILLRSPQAQMNLKLTRDILQATDEQPYGFLRVRGREVAHEVDLMAQAGFVEASLHLEEDPPMAVINRLTDAGDKLLHVLREKLISPETFHPESRPSHCLRAPRADCASISSGVWSSVSRQRA